MNDVNMTWVDSDSIQYSHKTLTVRQVYVWIITSDKQIVVVSKNGSAWQFPGGKPNSGENIFQKAQREVYEETGLVLNNQKLRFFGYYIVEDNKSKNNIIQIRMYYNTKESSKDLKLMTLNEDNNQLQSEKINYAKTVSVESAKKLITWLSSSGEYKKMTNNNIL